jgi:hypothetical protein
MLSHIIERGSTSQRRWAIKTLRISDQLRQQRLYFLEEAQVLFYRDS